jgi:hypothetical protein
MGCGAPIWVDDAEFAIDRHLVDREVIDRPGDRHLLDLAAELICERMPLEHPPWRAYLVAGSPGGRVRALVLVVHHVMADGLGGLAVLHALADPGLEPLLREFPQRRPPYRSLAADAARQRRVGSRTSALSCASAWTGSRSSAPPERTLAWPVVLR